MVVGGWVGAAGRRGRRHLSSVRARAGLRGSGRGACASGRPEHVRPRDQLGQTAPAEVSAQCASDPRRGESGLRGAARRTHLVVAVFTVRTVAVLLLLSRHPS